MSLSDRYLKQVRWALIATCLACVLVGMYARPQGATALMLFTVFFAAGIPAAMLSLQLRYPRWVFKLLERR